MHGTQDVGPWLLHRTDDRRELAVMSYAERKAVQLARSYISAKRVSLDSPVGARTRRDEHPLYHEKNVVAYPQTPDAVAPLLGLRPADLPKVLVVQLHGHPYPRARARLRVVL